MATASEPKLMTAEAFLAAELGEGRFELVRGEVIALPPPRPDHGRVVARLGFKLESFGRESGIGYTLTESAVATDRGPDSLRGPDISFYSHARWPEHQVDHGLPLVSPDLAVEVLSPDNRRESIDDKIAEYFRAGVLMVWVIDLKRRRVVVDRDGGASVSVFHEGDTLEGFPELPGFACPVADLFPPAPPQ